MKRISVTNKLLKYMFESNQNAIVGGYSDYKTVCSAVIKFNQNHKLNLKVRQQKMILINPITAESTRVWLISIVGASNNPNFIEKKIGRPKK